MPKHTFEMPRSLIGWLALPLLWLWVTFFQLLAVFVSAVVEAPPSVFQGVLDALRRR